MVVAFKLKTKKKDMILISFVSTPLTGLPKSCNVRFLICDRTNLITTIRTNISQELRLPYVYLGGKIILVYWFVSHLHPRPQPTLETYCITFVLGYGSSAYYWNNNKVDVIRGELITTTDRRTHRSGLLISRCSATTNHRNTRNRHRRRFPVDTRGRHDGGGGGGGVD